MRRGGGLRHRQGRGLAAGGIGACEVYSDLDELLADPDIDAVEVLTPTHLHYDHVLQPLEAGSTSRVRSPGTNRVEQALGRWVPPPTLPA